MSDVRLIALRVRETRARCTRGGHRPQCLEPSARTTEEQVDSLVAQARVECDALLDLVSLNAIRVVAVRRQHD